MTKDEEANAPAASETKPGESALNSQELLPLPALAAIGLYLLVLALVFAAAFVAASAGLLRLKRWAWALALGAVFLLVVYNLWIFSTLHQGAALVQGLLNLVFFLYLVRPEVRERLR